MITIILLIIRVLSWITGGGRVRVRIVIVGTILLASALSSIV